MIVLVGDVTLFAIFLVVVKDELILWLKINLDSEEN